MSNTKTKLFIASILALFGFFMTINTASAQIANTSQATNIGNNYATLNAYLSSNNNGNVSAWFEWGINSYYYSNRTNQVYYGATSGTMYSHDINGLTQSTTYYYRSVVQNSNGQITYGNQITFTTTNSYYGYNYYNYGINQPVVTTYSATTINTNSVTLNGYINPNGLYTTRWFEWGTNSNYLNNSTVKINHGSYPGNFTEPLYNLNSNTVYYYRAVVQSNTGIIIYGNILNFITTNGYLFYTCANNSCIPITAPIIPTPKIVKSEIATKPKNTTTIKTNDIIKNSDSLYLVSLNINQNNETIKKGDVVEYTINYKNISLKNLKDVILQISIPKELEFIETSRGTFSTENNTIISNIGNLNIKEESNLKIRVKVATSANTNKLIVITANLAYTIVDSNIQEEVFAYTKNTIVNRETTQIQQGALIFLAGNNFIPNTLLGWLLIILLLILIVLAVKKAYFEPKIIPVLENQNKSH